MSRSWALGRGILRLPVANTRPIQLDVVVNLSASGVINQAFFDQTGIAFLMQIGNVLTQLDLKNGCVRFSAIDILRRQTFAQAEDGPHVDWNKLAAMLAKIDPLTIDAGALASQNSAATRFVEFLQLVTSTPGACGADGQPPQHVLVVLSDEFLFPLKSEKAAIDPRALTATQCYYLEMSFVVVPKPDDIANLLKPLHPVRIAFFRPIQFRQALAQIIVNLEKSN